MGAVPSPQGQGRRGLLMLRGTNRGRELLLCHVLSYCLDYKAVAIYTSLEGFLIKENDLLIKLREFCLV